MLDMAQSEPPCVAGPSSFDADPWALNCLKRHARPAHRRFCAPHNPADKLTKLCPTPYTTAGAAPRWEAFQRQIAAEDNELIDSSCALGGMRSPPADVREQVFFRAVGHGVERQEH
jgi:putative DNA primase/helicase